MRKTVLTGILLIFCFCLFPMRLPAAEETVYYIPVQEEISPAVATTVRRGLRQAQNAGARAVVIEISTPGGLVDAALLIRDAIVESDIQVIAFVRGRAWSAGALIALAADQLVMTPGSSMGAAEPIPTTAKNVAAWKSEMEATASRNGRDPAIAGAMVDRNAAIPSLVQQGELLSLTAVQASEVGYADLLADDRNELLVHYGLSGTQSVEVTPTWSERAAGILTRASVAPLLLIVGFTGIILEMFIPGWGIAGIIGVMSLGLFFGGHMLAGLAGWEALLSFIVGLLLLLLEIFVLPGFGVAGIGGILLISAGIFLAAGDPLRAARTLLLAMLGTGAILVFAARHFDESRVWQRLRLGVSLNRAGGYIAAGEKENLVGQTGTAVTTLRPAGIAAIGGVRVDVVSEGSYIPAGASIEVVKVEGVRVIVRPEKAKE
ncbi:MAG: NfeD family protein [bacterium]|jgi:membrane-bound serine protease (ClpP class)